jgi:hypothetical protein
MRTLANRRPGAPLLALLLLLTLPFPSLLGCGSGGSDLAFPTEYQAIFLDNGQVFFGKLEKSGPSYLTLRDVFYIKAQVEQGKKEAKNLLVKRGLEWHAPDYMLINTRHVVLIEPVAPESQVAQLIQQYKQGPPPVAAPAPVAPKAKEEEKPPPAPKTKKGKRTHGAR